MLLQKYNNFSQIMSKLFYHMQNFLIFAEDKIILKEQEDFL